MRRLGRALLRAPWARRTAALTLTLGLFAGSSVMVSSTVLAATPGSTGGLLQLGSLGLGGGDGSTSSGLISTLTQTLSSLDQQVCTALPVTCQTGTQVFEIPSGVLTLGMPRPHPHFHAPLTGTALSTPRLPSTGCILGFIGCSTPSPKASAAATVSPSPSSSSTTTTSTTTKTTTSSPTATPAPSGSCVLGLLGSCPSSGGGLLGGVTSTLGNTVNGLVGGTSNSTATPSPAPGSSGLCLLSCPLLQLGGSGCTASVLGSCLVPTSNQSSGGSSSGSGGGACVGTICLLGSSCALSAGSSCLVGALLPGLPGILPGAPSGSSPGSSSQGGSSQNSGGGGGAGSGSNPGGTASGLPLISDSIPAGASQTAGSGGGQGLNAPQTPGGDATVGLVNGITFGHGLILWPLFGLLDLAALAGLVVVVRRRWSANPG